MDIGCLNKFGHNAHSLREYAWADFKEKNVSSIEFYLSKLTALYKKGRSFLVGLNFTLIRNKFKRSERRETCYLVLSHILNHLNLSSWGERNGKGMATYKRFTIGSFVDILKLSWSSVQRALVDLVQAGYIHGEDHVEGWGKTSTTFVVLNKLFDHLGLRKKDLATTTRFADVSKTLKKRDRDYKNVISKDTSRMARSTHTAQISLPKTQDKQNDSKIPKNAFLSRLEQIQRRFATK